MSQILTKTLHRLKPLSFSRYLSSKPQLIIIEPNGDSSSTASSKVTTTGGRKNKTSKSKKLENLIQRLIVHKCTPVWLPFIPGSSFWVPTPPKDAVVKLVDQLLNPLTKEQYLSLTDVRGWPSSSFFVSSEQAYKHKAKKDVKVEVDLELATNNTSRRKNEEED